MSEGYWNEYWEARQARLRQRGGEQDAAGGWLDPYLDFLRAEGVRTVLEIGCGAGNDTRMLVSAGFAVTATDYSAEALAVAQSIAGDAQFLKHDTREPFPFPDGAFDLILASLSLHYFDAPTTQTIVQELARLLTPRGLLLYRLNSQRDPHATTPERGVPRFYYTEAMCQERFAAWETLALTERTIDYAGHPKTLWEGLVRRGIR